MPGLRISAALFLLTFSFLASGAPSDTVWLSAGPPTQLLFDEGATKWIAGRFTENKVTAFATRVGSAPNGEASTLKLPSAWSAQAIVTRPQGGTIAVVTHRVALTQALKRFGADGALDEAFSQKASASLRALAIGPIAVDASDRVYVVTRDVDESQVTRASLSRLLADGTRDESFRPTPELSHYYALLPEADGSVMAAGSGFVRYSRNGKLDASFKAPDELQNVLHFLRATDGTWYVIESAVRESRYDLDDTSARGMPFQPQLPWRLVHLSSDGERDVKFAAPIDWGGLPTSLAESADHTILVAGSIYKLVNRAQTHYGIWFNSKGKSAGSVPVPKDALNHVPALATRDGSLLTRSTASRSTLLEKRARSGKVIAKQKLAFQTTALFSTAAGIWASRREETLSKSAALVKWDGVTIDADFARAAAESLPDAVQFVSRLPSGKFLVAAGDEMTTSFGQKPLRLELESGKAPAVGSLFRLKEDGTRDTTFALDPSLAGSIRSIALSPTGRVALVGHLTANEGALNAKQAVLLLRDDGRVDRELLKPTTALSSPGTDAAWKSDGSLLILLSGNPIPVRMKPDGKIEVPKKDPAHARADWNQLLAETVDRPQMCATGHFEFGKKSQESFWTRFARLYHGLQLALGYAFQSEAVRYADFNEKKFRWALFGQILSGKYSGFATQAFLGEGVSPLGRFEADGELDTNYARQIASVPALQSGQIERAIAAPDGTVFTMVRTNAGRQEIVKLHADGTQDSTYPVFGADRGELKMLALEPKRGVWVSGKFRHEGKMHSLALVPLRAGTLEYFLPVE